MDDRVCDGLYFLSNRTVQVKSTLLAKQDTPITSLGCVSPQKSASTPALSVSS